LGGVDPYHHRTATNALLHMIPRLAGSILSTRLDGCLPLAEALAALRTVIASQAHARNHHELLQRFEVEIEPTDLLRWLAAQPAGKRFYFKNRESTLASAGLGQAAKFSSWQDPMLRQVLSRIGQTNVRPGQSRDSSSHSFGSESSESSEVMFFHAGCFDGGAVGKHAPEWAGFERMQIILPLVEMRRTSETVLAVHVVGDAKQALIALEECEAPLERLSLPRGLRISTDGDPVAWADGIDAALGAIASGSIEKVVLARTRGYCAIESIDPCAMLAALMEEEPRAFHFMVEQVPGCAFVGASPERLFRRVGDVVHSEAVAGTCGRGPDAASDDRLAGRLLASDKNRREHEIVIRRIESVLLPMVEVLDCAESPSVMRLRHVQHLMTGASGTLRPMIDDAQILSQLHPTPAVCGWPVEESRQFIRNHERMSRGLYSGIVGITTASHSEFSVAIRTALICGNEMTAYSGAGIVRGSDADAEWLETERKLSSFDAIVVRAGNERHESQHADISAVAFHRMVAGS